LTQLDNKVRVYEYAKSLNMSSKEIITIMKRLKLSVNNHMSVMEPRDVVAVEKFFSDLKANAAVKRAAEIQTAPPRTFATKTSDTHTAPIKSTATGNTSHTTPSGGEKMTVASQEKEHPPQIRSEHKASSVAPHIAQERSKSPEDDLRHKATAFSPAVRVQSQETNKPQMTAQVANTNAPNATVHSSTGVKPDLLAQQSTVASGTPSHERRPNNQGRTTGQTPRNTNQSGGVARPTGDRPMGQRPTGDRPMGQRPTGDRPMGQRPTGDRPMGQRPTGDRPMGQRPTGDRPMGQQRPTGDRPMGQRPTGDRPMGQRPTGDRGGARGGVPAKPTPAVDTKLVAQPARDRYKDRERERERTTKFSDGEFSDGKGRTRKKSKGANKAYSRSGAPKIKIDNTPKKIIARGSMTVGDAAKLLHKDASEVIKKLLFMGVFATINQEIDLDVIVLLAGEFGVEVEIKIAQEQDNYEDTIEADEEEMLIERPPVVTIMGHVDHGKTTLLDAIRQTNVVSGEAGGITQHIGAYQVEYNSKKITFLDTPGHEAFTSMRARGAQVTDITILVVAADDGVMPQTKEAIAHAKAAKVPIIVAINKMDKPDANPERIKQELTEYELVSEQWGGDTIFVNISAKAKTNLDQLLEMILLVAEVQEYRANPNKRARGTVIEAELDKGKGAIARILVQHGTLKIGDAIVIGNAFGRIRAMVNDKGRRVKEATPSTPIEITGLTEVPKAGDPFMVFEDERKAREIAESRTSKQRQADFTGNTLVSLDDLYTKIKEGELKDLNLILKGDAQGSVQALKTSLEKIDVEGIRMRILHAGVGNITESDVALAHASRAIIVGFNVRAETTAKQNADQEGVDIRIHQVIYQAIDEIQVAMKGMLAPVYREQSVGVAEVRNVFKVSKIGTIAGCMVTDGKVLRQAQVRLLREGKVIYEGKIESLKRFKDDAKEVAQGYECGISLEKWIDIKEQDKIEVFVMERVEV
jgi:translation initiation factor IF-2